MPSVEQRLRWNDVIPIFIQERLQAKLDKLKPDENAQRAELIAQHQRDTWLQNAAKRVQQIQAVTHSLKPIHPDARGTNLYVQPATLAPLAELGSHALGAKLMPDVVGNAAALDVYKLLKLEVAGVNLLAALQTSQPDALQALSTDPQQAQALRDAFVGLTLAREGGASSHVRAKQLYWLVGSDPCDDAAYHLLAPLYATSLAHAVYAPLQEARFGEANKAARQARREGKVHDGAYHEYRGLAVQKMGGTKPQNISQLNSERGGTNYLLASLPPPAWQTGQRYLPIHSNSVFDRAFGARPAVRKTVKAFLAFLLTDPEPNRHTRQQVDDFLDNLVDEVVIHAGELQSQPAGWSQDERYEKLAPPEKLWLDPGRAELTGETVFAQEWSHMDWPEQVGKRFANWLNAQLQGKLPVGDAEAREWRRVLLADDSWLFAGVSA
ncbi:MAG: type I-F CRISPR-associated protein Csy1 [Burkholderiaceae bacterium]|nr:type I-F CRISPR-associated protein Csy1 [Xylophilus sp.]MBP6558880.1 type I-F CRISPR-associated protein Csy1 [Burkholderiaceae bacterium]MBP6616861.1 type I-F CRISPR-associated protein Csy1 [Burkholderiaceae bacterium]MBP6650993.1 type I-F CRISPR-associated protein Csy1 [Xylophilus sp.]MBP7420787.1 type I-F CRISPR-associated protein Csy1 [Burkholderiaceae bacterium]